MAWFIITIFQLLIHFTVSFSSCDIKMLHGIWYKLEDWINRYLIQTYHRLSQEYFKSDKIPFKVALWLDFEQLSSYLFVYRRRFLVTISKRYMEFHTNWRIEWRDILFKLTRGYLKSISSNIVWLLGWLYGLILNNYPFTYSFIGIFFGVAVWYCYMEFDTIWRIESEDILFKLTTGYLKSISSHIE